MTVCNIDAMRGQADENGSQTEQLIASSGR